MQHHKTGLGSLLCGPKLCMGQEFGVGGQNFGSFHVFSKYGAFRSAIPPPLLWLGGPLLYLGPPQKTACTPAPMYQCTCGFTSAKLHADRGSQWQSIAFKVGRPQSSLDVHDAAMHTPECRSEGQGQRQKAAAGQRPCVRCRPQKLGRSTVNRCEQTMESQEPSTTGKRQNNPLEPSVKDMCVRGACTSGAQYTICALQQMPKCNVATRWLLPFRV